MGDRYAEVMERIETTVTRRRALSADATRQEIDDLYTDACATILLVEGERMDVERRLTAIVRESGDDPEAIRSSVVLAQRRVELDRELGSLRRIVAGLATAAEWMRDPAADDVAGLID